MDRATRQRWRDHRPVLELALGAITAELRARPAVQAAGLAAVDRLRTGWWRCRADHTALLELRSLAPDGLPGELVIRAALESIEGWANELENA